MNLEKKWHKTDPNKEIEEGVNEYESEQKEKNRILENKENLYIEEIHNENKFVLQTIENLDEIDPEEVYKFYSEAIKRRDREPLEEESFISHFFEGNNFDQSICFGNKEKGYLLGSNKFGAFLPSHFAPRTIRGGYELLAALGDSEHIPSILAVTEDINETLKKMPSWKTLEIDQDFMSFFRNELVKKKIMYNNHPAVERVMQGLLMEFFNQNEY